MPSAALLDADPRRLASLSRHTATTAAPPRATLYDVPQRVAWARDRERQILMDDLAAGRPAAIVVERRDVFPMVTGDAIDSADTRCGFPALTELIASRFARATAMEDFDVYLEQPQGNP